MKALPAQRQQVLHSLRSRTADFFVMEVSQAARQAPAKDCHPLRRTFRVRNDKDFFVSNKNMCTALWQLMQRC